VISTTIQQQKEFEFVTEKGDVYVINGEPKNFELNLYEFVTMRDFLLLPGELLELKHRLKLEEGSSQ
jgi:hypothetical protein